MKKLHEKKKEMACKMVGGMKEKRTSMGEHAGKSHKGAFTMNAVTNSSRSTGEFYDQAGPGMERGGEGYTQANKKQHKKGGEKATQSDKGKFNSDK